MDCDDETTFLNGTSTIGDFVWRDLDRDGNQDGGSETGIANVTLKLYWDKNGNGTLDTDDPLIDTTTTNASGGYDFTGVPNGKFLVQVDRLDSDITGLGYGPTTKVVHAVTITTASTDYNNADFGFGPTLEVKKSITSGSCFNDKPTVHTIFVRNLLPAAGEPVPGAAAT